MEQLVARWAHNPKAVGSSPAPATKYLCKYLFYKGIVFYIHLIPLRKATHVFN